MSRPFGTTIFCDSVREEISGKSTYVGVYKGAMIFSGKPPAIWPSLFIVATIQVPSEYEYSTIEFMIAQQLDGSNLEQVLFAQQLEKPKDISKQIVPPDKMMKINMISELSMIEMTGNGTLKVRAYFDDHEIKLGALQIIFDRDETKT